MSYSYPYTAGGSTYPSYPAATLSADVSSLRMRQIESLRQFGLQYRELERGAKFEVMVAAPPPTRPFTLIVALPYTFPTAGPLLSINPPMHHSLIDPNTGAVLPHASEMLRGWGMHCNLGKLVWDIQQKLISDPPKEFPAGFVPASSSSPYPPASTMSPPGVGPVPSPLPQQQVAPSGSPYPPPSNLPGGPGYQQGQQQARPVAAFNPLSIPLTQLDTMTLEQLNELLANESKLDDFISQLPAVVELNKLRADLQESNLAQAKKNEAAAAELGKLQAEYETRRAAAEAARAQYDEKAKQQAQALEAFSPQALAARLDALARESDAASEAASQKFLSGEMPLAEFQRVYRDLRVEYHTRCAKREALLHPR